MRSGRPKKTWKEAVKDDMNRRNLIMKISRVKICGYVDEVNCSILTMHNDTQALKTN